MHKNKITIIPKLNKYPLFLTIMFDFLLITIRFEN
jgi:hypothetical protein